MNNTPVTTAAQNHVMLDLETLGTGANAVIVSIGAVKFNFATRQITDKFYIHITPQSCVDIGLVMDAGTVMWWMQQSDAARKALYTSATDIKAALDAFSRWIGEGQDNYLWGNGSDFDNVILASAYKAARIHAPWRYSRNRCYRTVAAFFPAMPMQRIGTHHNALDDAQAQAQHLLCMPVFVPE